MKIVDVLIVDWHGRISSFIRRKTLVVKFYKKPVISCK